LTTRQEVQAIAAATTLPLVLGNTQGELDDAAFLASQRVRIALQGHTPFAAATQAVYETLKALREGTPPKELKGLPSAQLTSRVMRDTDAKTRATNFLGLKK
jgi:oxaloacetate decarboxylase